MRTQFHFASAHRHVLSNVVFSVSGHVWKISNGKITVAYKFVLRSRFACKIVIVDDDKITENARFTCQKETTNGRAILWKIIEIGLQLKSIFRSEFNFNKKHEKLNKSWMEIDPHRQVAIGLDWLKRGKKIETEKDTLARKRAYECLKRNREGTKNLNANDLIDKRIALNRYRLQHFNSPGKRTMENRVKVLKLFPFKRP